MKLICGLSITLLTISSACIADNRQLLQGPAFNRYPSTEAPLVLPKQDEVSAQTKIPENNIDEFILNIQRCVPGSKAHTPYGPNEVLGLKNRNCHVTFSLQGLSLDCFIPEPILANVNKGIDTSRYCRQVVTPLTPGQQRLLQLLAPNQS